MVTIAMSYIHYPCSVGVLFKRAFRRLGCKVYSVGPFTDKLPWTNRDVSRYVDRPDLELGWGISPPIETVISQLPTRPDVVVQVDAGYHLSGRMANILNVVIATDPHAFPAHYYQESFRDADVMYMMQACYAKPFRDIGLPVRWLPYAFDPEFHYWNPNTHKTHFVTLITGLMYPERILAKQQLEVARFSVFNEGGYLFDEGCEIYNRGVIALNWSSRKDLPMRFWEGLAYRNVVLTDRAWDLPLVAEQFGIREDEHYLAFDTVEELIHKANMVRANPSHYAAVAARGYAAVWAGQHTYTTRAAQILRDTGLVN